MIKMQRSDIQITAKWMGRMKRRKQDNIFEELVHKLFGKGYIPKKQQQQVIHVKEISLPTKIHKANHMKES